MLHRESHRFVSCLTSQLSYNITPPIHCQQQIPLFLHFFKQYQILYLKCINCTRLRLLLCFSHLLYLDNWQTSILTICWVYLFSIRWHSIHIVISNSRNIIYVLNLSCLFIGDPFHVVCNTIYQNLRKRCSAYYFINYKTNMKN